MPLKDRPKNLRSYVQFASEVITRAEFKAAFGTVKTLISKAFAQQNERISAQDARIDAKLATLKDGYTPVKGRDYFDGNTPVAGVDFPLPKDGEPGPAPDEQAIVQRVKDVAVPEILLAVEQNLPALGQAIRDSLTLLPEDDKLDASLIKGLEAKLAEHTKKLMGSLGPGGGTSFSIQQSGVQKVQQPLSLNFKGAGAPTISLGSNGTTNLDFSGTAGTAVYEEVLSGTGVTFTLAHAPLAGSLRLYRGGARQQSGAGNDYTLSGAIITLAVAKAAGEIIVCDYNF